MTVASFHLKLSRHRRNSALRGVDVTYESIRIGVRSTVIDKRKKFALKQGAMVMPGISMKYLNRSGVCAIIYGAQSIFCGTRTHQ